MRKTSIIALSLVIIAVAGACARWHAGNNPAADNRQLLTVLQPLKTKYAPEQHLGLYSVGLHPVSHGLLLTGQVDSAQARIDTLSALERVGIKATDHLQVLPDPKLGEEVWGIAALSVASAREQPDHKAGMALQVLLGRPVHLLKATTNRWWYFVQTIDGYAAWLEKGTFVRCTYQQLNEWSHSPLLFVTAQEELIRDQPKPDAQPVADVVVADLVKNLGRQGNWFRVELPDARSGFLPADAAEDYASWKLNRRLTADNLESTARQFIGRPYLWGGDSPKGLDCSGFTRLVFLLNGLDLPRNSSQQASEGVDVPLAPELNSLRKGDLLFFGAPARHGQPQRIHHVGLYLGNKLFIHSSERVQINSLDPSSPIRDEHRIRTLLRARRILP